MKIGKTKQPTNNFICCFFFKIYILFSINNASKGYDNIIKNNSVYNNKPIASYDTFKLTFGYQLNF